MSCSSIVFSLFMISPCTDAGGDDINELVAAALSAPDRPAEDVLKDEHRKPGEVLTFFEVKPGMTVLDLFSGGGYYTELLSSIVGENGEVIAHTNEAYISFTGETYQKRYAGNRLTNTKTIIAEADDLQLGDNTLDAALLVLTWHDFLFADPENGWQAIDETLLVDKLCKAVKPGGTLGLIDHAADPGGDPSVVAQTMHRVDPQVVRDFFKPTCFKLDGEAEFLGNADDDHSLSPFDEAIRGKTDRFVFRLTRK